MPASFLPWSHSRRKAYMECPKKLYHTQVAQRGHPDRVDQVQSQAMLDGNAIDNALTARISAGTPLPKNFEQWEPLVANIIAAPGSKMTQMQIAFDQSFQVCGYKDWNRAWLRVVFDLAVVHTQSAAALIIDWKNGMVWPDSDQLKLFAAAGFHYFPEINLIDTSYVWLKHGITTDETYRRQDLAEMWASLLPDVERMQVSFRTGHWPATPSRNACKWCPVPKSVCPSKV